MSGKCNVQIAFDRPERTWYGGETVSGTAFITAMQELRCNEIRLVHSWRTHGRGNRDNGPSETITLAGPATLNAGQTLEYPFSFPAPAYPVTYHGHLIYIDHYVKLEVDVSWARNPSTEEDFLILPGDVPPQFTGRRDQIVTLRPENTGKPGLILKIILGLVVITFIGVLAMLAFFLIPIAVIGLFIWWIRRQALKSRLGQVDISMPHRLVAPGEDWPMTIHFKARKSFPVNGITITFQGVETAASGSGTDKKTHTHTLVTQTHQIRESGLIEQGEVVHEELLLTIPDSQAYSFEASDNSIKWTAEVRIDIPRFPDWVVSEPLQFVPAEFLEPADGPANAPNEPTVRKRVLPPDADDRSEPVMLMPDNGFSAVDERRNHQSTSDGRSEAESEIGSMNDLIREIDRAGYHAIQRQNAIDRASEVPLETSIVVDRVTSSVGTLMSDVRYEDGRAVIGKVLGTEHAILIHTLPENTGIVNTLRRGDVWSATIRITGWDSLYKRLTGRQI